MRLQPPSVPLSDPLLAAVRRRHPDVDLVQLAPEPPAVPADASDDATADARAAAAVEHVDRAATSAWAHVGIAPDGPSTRLAFGPVPGTVLARSRLSAVAPDRPGLLADLRVALEEDGWRFRRPWGEVERLVGRLGDLELRATYAERTGVLVVVLGSEPLAVGRRRATELVRG
jgi:hypothetical protein